MSNKHVFVDGRLVHVEAAPEAQRQRPRRGQ